jgi:very-short-patch-repair endonuclease
VPTRADETLARLLVRQDRVLTLPQALAAGLTPSAIVHRRRSGRWQLLRPGLYLAQSGVPSPEQWMRAGLLVAGPDALLDAFTALVLRGFRAVPPDARVHVVVPYPRHPRSLSWLVVRRARRQLDRRSCRGLPVVSVARSVIAAAAELVELRDVRALVAEAVQTGRCTVDELLGEAGGAQSKPLWRALAEVTAGAQSAPEAELMALLQRSGLPAARYNEPLYRPDGTFICRPDVHWPEHGVVVEVDSKQFHLSPRDWTETMRRHNRVTASGKRLLHFSPEQIRTNPHLVVTEIRAALAN